MTVIEKLQVKEGLVEGLRVAGFHGEIDPAYTPARRGPVFAMADGRAVEIVEEQKDSVVVELSERLVNGADSLEGAWTRTSDYPARLGWSFLILGPDERFRLDAVFALSHPQESREVTELLRWMASDTAVFDRGLGERQRAVAGDGDLSIWYCSVRDANEVLSRYGTVYTSELLQVVSDADALRVEKAAFRLWRAATKLEDIYLVAAALQKVGYRRRRWEELLREGAREANPDERQAGVARALRALSGRADSTAPSSSVWSHRERLRARYLVSSTTAPLRQRVA